MMAKTKLATALPLCHTLVREGRFGDATTILDSIFPAISEDQWKVILGICEDILPEFRLNNIKTAFIYAKALSKNDYIDECIDFSRKVVDIHGVSQAAAVVLEECACLLEKRHYEEACIKLKDCTKYLEDQLLGLAWSRLGLSLFYLKKAWQYAYSNARLILNGQNLAASLLNEGFCWQGSNDTEMALGAWREALAHSQNNFYLKSRLHYNIGATILLGLDPNAEQHFLLAGKLTQKPECASLLPQILNGLAAFRRSQGEWLRAEAAYLESLALTESKYPDNFNRSEAYLGLVRTLRLAGRASEAAAVIELALVELELARQPLYLSRAAVYLALGHQQLAQADLVRQAEHGGPSSVHDQWLVHIHQAESLRQAGFDAEAVPLLQDMPTTTLHMREEAMRYTALMQLVRAAGRETPQPLVYPSQTTVTVRANGLLHVSVNGREVPISPASRMGELLVFLLENDGAATLEQITDALYGGTDRVNKTKIRQVLQPLPQEPRQTAPPTEPRRKTARQAINKVVQELRQALGWPASVISVAKKSGGGYALAGLWEKSEAHGHVTVWDYDIAQLRQKRSFRGRFLTGIYSNWAVDTEDSLLTDNPDIKLVQ
jgi:tetratricopeptide (TPR) repeat protein